MRAMALLGLLLLVLPGCFGGGDGDDGETTTSSTTTTSATNTTTSAPPAPVPNQPPGANLTADIDNGTAPLAVNFTLNATDLDGDLLNWTFDADGDGTLEANGTSADLPMNVSFTYNATGEFRAALNVTDGNASVTAFRLIVVAEGAGSLVERDDYFFDPATGMCHAKEYEELAPGVYAWGDWTMVEDNDVDGLQLENNHPARAVPFFNLALEDACVSGDQTAL